MIEVTIDGHRHVMPEGSEWSYEYILEAGGYSRDDTKDVNWENSDQTQSGSVVAGQELAMQDGYSITISEPV